MTRASVGETTSVSRVAVRVDASPGHMAYCRIPPGGMCIRSPVYSASDALESVLPEAMGCNFSFIPANFL